MESTEELRKSVRPNAASSIVIPNVVLPVRHFVLKRSQRLLLSEREAKIHTHARKETKDYGTKVPLSTGM